MSPVLLDRLSGAGRKQEKYLLGVGTEGTNYTLEEIELLESKHFVFPYDTTSENICQFTADYFRQEALNVLQQHNIDRISVRVQETETCYAELTVPVLAHVANGSTAAVQVGVTS